jgi:hypothetical protein
MEPIVAMLHYGYICAKTIKMERGSVVVFPWQQWLRERAIM